MIIDGENLIVGRVGTVVAKKALLGEDIAIVNCEKMIVTGKKQELIDRHLQRRSRGIPAKGPFILRSPDRFVRRMIRGMLPYKKPRGRDAFKKIMCYLGVPDEFKDKPAETIKEADVSKVKNLRYMTVGNLTKLLGGKYGQ